MKKISEFIINKRYFILTIFVILTILSIFLSTKVEINSDMTKYLPNDSETRIGLDIMEEEYKNVGDTSSLNIMFHDLSKKEKEQIYNELKENSYVSSVSYDDSGDYNKGKYTLYVLNVDAASDSKKAVNLYNSIKDDYKDYTYDLSGSIDSANTPILPTWIIVVAVSLVLIILLIMCESYIEPFLFLLTILIAIILNSGTNIIFDNVSNITSSISAILQLALSMDYSIMLMERFRQEKEKTSNQVEAMKKALYSSFQSISGSSVTTIVGLLTLVFMSFTIGKDLGLVLAKGVFLSLICIFCVLPALILLFDKLITKTTKKHLNIKLSKIGKIVYSIKLPLTCLFAIIFIASYFMQGNLGISYIASEDDQISKVFEETNQLAIIYKNEDENKIKKYLEELEANKKIDSVLGYSNTINQELPYNELKQKLNDFSGNLEIEDYLLRILYYNYYNKDISTRMTFKEFVNFVKADIYSNETLSKEIDNNMKNNIDTLNNFVDTSLINKERDIDDIANILQIDKESINNLMILYQSKNNNLTLTLKEFITFMNNNIVNDSKYNSSIDKSTRESLELLNNFIDSNTITKKMTSSEISNLLGMKKEDVDKLFLYYLSMNTNNKLSLNAFSNFVISDVLTDPNYSTLFDDSTKQSIYLLNQFSNKNIINQNMSTKELSDLFSIKESLVKDLLLLKYVGLENNSTYSASEFVLNTIYIKNNTNYLDATLVSPIEKLEVFAKNEGDFVNQKMSKQQLKEVFKEMDSNMVDNIYSMLNLPDSYLLSVNEFVDLIINNLGAYLDDSSLNNLKLLRIIMNDNNKYSSSDLSKMFGIPKTNVDSIYTLTDYVNANTSYFKDTPYNFVNFILNNKDNEKIKNYLDNNTVNQLLFVNTIMDSSLNNKEYSYNELSELLGIDSSSIKNIYTLYMSKNSNRKLTPKEFIEFIINNKNSDILKSSLDSSTLKKINTLNNFMNGVLSNTSYNANSMAKLLGIDKDTVQLLYGVYLNNQGNSSVSIYNFVNFLLNDVVTDNKYSSLFSDEQIKKLETIKSIMDSSIKGYKYSNDEIIVILNNLVDGMDSNTIELLYMYYGSMNDYNDNWRLTIEEFINYLNDDILKDERLSDFIDKSLKKKIKSGKKSISSAKNMLVGSNYSRIVLNTKYGYEDKDTFAFIKKLNKELGKDLDEYYVVGDSTMAYEMNDSFRSEFNFISILTMIAIFIVVAITFKSLKLPIILVFVIQSAVYMTMSILGFSKEPVYFIAILIVQSILMGATIDYAILYCSYYLENRKKFDVGKSIVNSYNQSINAILTSSSILIIATFIVGHFATAIISKICMSIAAGTLCSIILILIFIPALLSTFDRFIIKQNK